MYHYIEIVKGKVMAVYNKKDPYPAPEAKYGGRVRMITQYQHDAWKIGKYHVENIPPELKAMSEVRLMIDLVELDNVNN